MGDGTSDEIDLTILTALLQGKSKAFGFFDDFSVAYRSI